MSITISSICHEVSQRVTGPGGLYNVGNAIGLLGGIALHIAATAPSGGSDLGHGLLATFEYLAGSFGAAALTLAMLVFFWSGEQYHRAWRHGAPPDARLNRIGDVSSGWGALLLGFGLFLMGQPLLAATAGLLHAVGKFGSALPRRLQDHMPFGSTAFRATVLASRIPAIVLVLVEAEQSLIGQPAQPLAASLLLLTCYLIWFRADLMLLKS